MTQIQVTPLATPPVFSNPSPILSPPTQLVAALLPSAAGSSISSDSLDLAYRPATLADAAELKRMRRACGWGEENIEDYIHRSLTKPEEYKLFLFEEKSSKESVGMGAIDLVDPYADDRELADPTRNIMMLSSLFIYKKFQGRGLGNRSVDLLESICKHELGAKYITINTREKDDTGATNPTKLWYLRHGYVEFRPPAGRYRISPDPEAPLVLACFCRKDATLVA